MNTHRPIHKIRPCQVPHQRGLTLIEILIGTVLSLILVGGVMQMFVGSKQTFDTEQAIAHIQENARIALDLIVRDISSGGYMGCLDTADGTKITNTLSIQDDINGLAYQFTDAIYGTDGGTDIDGNDNPDTLFIRRVSEGTAIPMTAPMTVRNDDSIQVDTTPASYDALRPWDIVALSDCSDAVVFLITNDPETSGGKIEHKTAIVVPTGPNQPNAGQSNGTTDFGRIFGAANGSAAKIYSAGTTQYDIRPSTSGTTTSLFVGGNEFIEGVENFQVTYGINSTPTAGTPTLAGPYVDADGVNATNNWSNVISIRVALTLVSLERVTNTGDGLLHKTFTSTIRMRNRAPG